jgi:hypothetical protein
VALSLRYDRLDWFWFTLMHEVAYLALGHKGSHLDNLESDATKERDEQAANLLAEDCLLSREKFSSFLVRRGRASPELMSRTSLPKKACTQALSLADCTSRRCCRGRTWERI